MRFQEFSKFTIRPHLFENKQQYKQILDTMVTAGVIDQSTANSVLNQARQALKRADRIIWWLRWWRTITTFEVLGKELEQDIDQQRKQQIFQIMKKFGKSTGTGMLPDERHVNEFKHEFALEKLNNHWAAMFEQSPQVNQVEWEAKLDPSQLELRLSRAQEKWQEKQAQELKPEPDDQVVIDYGKYAWVKLDRAYCGAEGQAMGHCGNRATPQEGDRILSFRSKVGETRQRPHLTFILDKDGYLGEMKGRANEKPSEKYHPYIIDLLQKDFVKGIKGGGYMPGSNFSLSDLDEEQMNALISKKPSLMTPEEAYTYAVEKVEGRWPEAEDVIAQSPEYALSYAENVIEGRFPEGEEAIAQDPEYAYIYARDVIEGRFPEAEDTFLQELEVPDSRRKLEVIEIVYYASEMIGGRWPEAEDFIKQNVEAVVEYAKNVIKGRWPPGEKAIKRNPLFAYIYAKEVIKGRWPEGEETIKRNFSAWKKYLKLVKQSRPDAD